MKTRAFHFNEAQKTIQDAQTISRADAIVIARAGDKIPFSLYLPEVADAIEAIEATGKYAYNSDIAHEIIKVLGIEDNATIHDRIETIVYGSRKYIRANQTVAKYREFWGAGYISIHDTVEHQDGKAALLSGTASIDWFTLKKDDVKVKIVVKGDVRGYQNPRMRTRYYRAAVDSDLFVKII